MAQNANLNNKQQIIIVQSGGNASNAINSILASQGQTGIQ